MAYDPWPMYIGKTGAVWLGLGLRRLIVKYGLGEIYAYIWNGCGYRRGERDSWRYILVREEAAALRSYQVEDRKRYSSV